MNEGERMASKPVPMTFGLVTETKNSPKKRSSAPKRTPLPTCPKCGAQMHGWNMKFNDYNDEGNLVEGYRCDDCGKKFTISYEGRTERSHWWYDEDGGW